MTPTVPSAAERRRAAYEKHTLLPVIDDHDGPVYVNDNYYACADEALDALVDLGDHPAQAIAHPCVENKAYTPSPTDLLDYVQDNWAENFEDFDPIGFSDDIKRAAENLVVRLQRIAPTVWEVDQKHRIILVAEDPDQDYDPDEDTYD